DFAVATAISVAKPIEKPREVEDLIVTVRGIGNSKLILSDSRQQGKSVDGVSGAYHIHIAAQTFDASNSAVLPSKNPDVQPFIRRAPYLETDANEIAETAVKIKGAETNAYKVAVAIRDWVHTKMTPDYSIGVPRSCTDVLRKPRGVCRDYATLFC